MVPDSVWLMTLLLLIALILALGGWLLVDILNDWRRDTEPVCGETARMRGPCVRSAGHEGAHHDALGDCWD